MTSPEAARPTEARTDSRALRAERTRAGLVDAARKTFEEKGFLASSVADIVKRAGVSHGLFYHYFSSREDVLLEIVTEADARLWAPMNQITLDRSAGASPAERLRTALRSFLEAYVAQVPIMRVVEEVSRYDVNVRAVRIERLSQYRDEISASIRVLQDRGLVDRKLDPTILALVLGSITMRFPEMWMMENLVDCSLDEAVNHMSAIFIGALGLEEVTDREKAGPVSRKAR